MLVLKTLETSELSLNLAQRTPPLSPVLMVSKGKLEVLSYLFTARDPRILALSLSSLWNRLTGDFFSVAPSPGAKALTSSSFPLLDQVTMFATSTSLLAHWRTPKQLPNGSLTTSKISHRSQRLAKSRSLVIPKATQTFNGLSTSGLPTVLSFRLS